MKIRLVLLVLAVALAVAIAGVVFYSRSEHHSDSESSSVDRVKIEMRAMPKATIRVDGKKVGTTPMSLQYPRSTRQVVVEATLVRHLVKRGAKKDEIYKDTRKITVDRDHLLDFTFETAQLIGVEEENVEP